MNRAGVGVSPAAVRDAVRNPIRGVSADQGHLAQVRRKHANVALDLGGWSSQPGLHRGLAIEVRDERSLAGIPRSLMPLFLELLEKHEPELLESILASGAPTLDERERVMMVLAASSAPTCVRTTSRPSGASRSTIYSASS